MVKLNLQGKISSFQSIGTVDGPGLRYVVFMQGCPLRCSYCHNPETWGFDGGQSHTVAEVVSRLKRYKTYFGRDGGLTLSGGEPLYQSEFVLELLKACHLEGINTAVDTSGVWPAKDHTIVEAIMAETDLVLLDVKFTDQTTYQKQTLGSLEQVLATLQMRQTLGREVWVRQVIIPGLNDSEKQVISLRKLLNPYSCVSKIELLPFRKLCLEKYKNLGLVFPLADTAEADPNAVDYLSKLIVEN